MVTLVTYSLSKWSNYPNSIREILAISQNSILEILAMSSKNYLQLIDFCQIFQVSMKKSKHPILHSIKNTSLKKKLRSKKHKFLDLAMFSENIEKVWDIAKI